MKKVLALLLILAIAVITISSCAVYSETDKETAELYAKQQAYNYYVQYFKGKTISGVAYYSCDPSIKETEFKGGKYIVTISLNPSVSSGGYYLSPQLMDIEYSIIVKNGNPEVVDTNYYY